MELNYGVHDRRGTCTHNHVCVYKCTWGGCVLAVALSGQNARLMMSRLPGVWLVVAVAVSCGLEVNEGGGVLISFRTFRRKTFRG